MAPTHRDQSITLIAPNSESVATIFGVIIGFLVAASLVIVLFLCCGDDADATVGEGRGKMKGKKGGKGKSKKGAGKTSPQIEKNQAEEGEGEKSAKKSPDQTLKSTAATSVGPTSVTGTQGGASVTQANASGFRSKTTAPSVTEAGGQTRVGVNSLTALKKTANEYIVMGGNTDVTATNTATDTVANTTAK